MPAKSSARPLPAAAQTLSAFLLRGRRTMPRPVRFAAYAAALLCAALLAQTFDPSPASRAGAAAAPPPRASRTDARAHTPPDFGRLPLSFESNRGQAGPRVKYLA